MEGYKYWSFKLKSRRGIRDKQRSELKCTYTDFLICSQRLKTLAGVRHLVWMQRTPTVVLFKCQVFIFCFSKGQLYATVLDRRNTTLVLHSTIKTHTNTHVHTKHTIPKCMHKVRESGEQSRHLADHLHAERRSDCTAEVRLLTYFMYVCQIKRAGQMAIRGCGCIVCLA